MLGHDVMIYCTALCIYFIKRAHCISVQQEIDGSNPAGKWIGHGDVRLQQNAARSYLVDSNTRHKVTIHLARLSIRAVQLNDSESEGCHSRSDSGLKCRMFIYGVPIDRDTSWGSCTGLSSACTEAVFGSQQFLNGLRGSQWTIF